jgi:hypothetical protein
MGFTFEKYDLLRVDGELMNRKMGIYSVQGNRGFIPYRETGVFIPYNLFHIEKKRKLLQNASIYLSFVFIILGGTLPFWKNGSLAP